MAGGLAVEAAAEAAASPGGGAGKRPHCPEVRRKWPRRGPQGNGHTAQSALKVGRGTATLPNVRRKWAGERPHCPKRGKSGLGNGHKIETATLPKKLSFGGTATLAALPLWQPERPALPKVGRNWAEERPHCQPLW